jgi:tRNA nucleotidyltransferase (CCA-adding enzyme)
VEPGDIDRDLARRDFSINAMAISLGTEAWGELLDPFEGRRDLDLGVVRVLHDGSFTDDATRILRAVRYAGRMGFRLEAETERLLKRDLARLDGISGDRVRRELARVFAEEQAVTILGAAQALGVLAAVHPALEIDAAAVQRRLAAAKERLPLTGPWLLAVLVFRGDPSGRAAATTRLNLDSKWAGVVQDVGSVRNELPRLRQATVRRSEVHAALRHLDPVSIVGCAIAVEDELVRERLELFLTELRQVRPLLDGNDIIALGVTEGPRVGGLLGKLLDARLDGLISTREDEERLVRRSVEEPC